MSAKLRLGLPEYEEEHPDRICIYNGNYGPSGKKEGDYRWPWFVKQGKRVLKGGLPSHLDATDWLREHLNTQAVS